jgi:hypothetical protein
VDARSAAYAGPVEVVRPAPATISEPDRGGRHGRAPPIVILELLHAHRPPGQLRDVASGGLRTALRNLGEGYQRAGHEAVLIVPGASAPTR